MGFAAQEPWTSTTTTWAQLYGLRLTGPPNHTPPWCNHQRCNWHQSSTAVFLVYLGIDIYDNEITCGDMMIWQKHMSSHPCFIPSNCTLHPKLPWLWLCHWCQPGVSNASSPKAWGLMLASPSIFHLKNMSIRKKKTFNLNYIFPKVTCSKYTKTSLKVCRKSAHLGLLMRFCNFQLVTSGCFCSAESWTLETHLLRSSQGCRTGESSRKVFRHPGDGQIPGPR